MGWFSDFISDPIGTVGETGQKIIDTAKENPLAAAALIGAGYYYAPEIGAWFNPTTNQAVVGTATGAAEGATAVNLGTATAGDLAMAYDPVAANIAAGMTPEAAAAAAAKTAALGGTTLGALTTGAAGAAGLSELAKLGLISGGLNLAGGLLGGKAASNAASTAASQQAALAKETLGLGKFTPVGITNTFGKSQFTFDPKTGQITQAGYTVSPEIAKAQERLMGLGTGYLAQTPEQVAANYMAKQQELLAPSRERQMAQLQNQLFQTGRGGLSVGATGARPSGAAGLGATTPEMEAYYNALAQQDAALAAQAQQAGQQQVGFGAGLFGQAGQLEQLAQQPFGLSTSLANLESTAGARQASNYAQAMGSSIASQQAANSYSPWATALQGAGSNPLTSYGLFKLATG